MCSELYQNNPEAAFAQAQQSIAVGNLDAAFDICLALQRLYPQNTLLLNLLGSLEIRLGHFEPAVSWLQASLAIEPNQAVTLSELGNALNEEQRPDDALTCYNQAIELKADYVEVFVNRALIFNKQGYYGQALADLAQAIALKPDYAQAYAQQAYALSEQGHWQQALASYAQAIALKPDYAKAYANLGITLNKLKRYDEAVTSCAEAIRLKPDYPEAYCNLGISLNKLKRYQEALLCYQQALKLKPNNAEVYSNQGISLHALKRYPEALSSYDQAILLKPDYATAYSNRGITLDKLKRYQDALDSYDQAIALNADLAEAYAHKSITLNTCQEKSAALANVNQAIALQPDLVEAYINRGIVLNDQKKFSESLNSFQQAIALRADYPEAFYNRAITYSDMHNFSEGLLNYQMAIALNPDYAEAYWNKALLKLMLGDFSEGWQLYEWRWQVADFPSKKREFQVPLWLGNSALTGKTILLHAEQGLGDSLQFCRYALLVADLAAKVLLEVPDALTYLLTSLSANISIIETGSALPTFDLHCPLMSLPLAFNTQLNSIPCQIPYLFAETEKLSYWRQYLSKKTLLRVGLVVSGSAGHGNDHNRSLPFAVFEPLLNFPISWHCLQKQIRNEDMVFLATHPEIKLYQDLLIDFSDTAALIMNMDLVISVDTAVAHLAGALGKPVWILLPHHADYRWLLDRSDSPWYPSARLFRQAQAGDSLAVITEVKTKLQSILQTNFA